MSELRLMDPIIMEALQQEIERMRVALEIFADEDAWSEWDDCKGAYLLASFKGAGEPWRIARAALETNKT